MSKVWIVLKNVPFEYDEILGVYATEAGARAAHPEAETIEAYLNRSGAQPERKTLEEWEIQP